ncbi:MAG: TonB-dependent receptor [Steroidobacteraceae bacterium]|nr:TonB-dependent receptor [Steroidobacteraceae bacterium]
MQRAAKQAFVTMPIAAGMLALAPHAYAQEQALLEEVVVTAQKRSENLQQVPLSIQALNTEKLEQLDIQNFEDFARLMPSITTSSGGSGFSNVYMRGVASGDNINHSGSQPSVGIYLDEQPITTITGALDVHMYDIARVEALAGPQGTLYGASSQAGTIRIVTNKPDTAAFDAGFGLEGNTLSGGDMGYVAEGFVNLPLSDKAAIRLVGWSKRDPGWVDNVQGTRTYPVSGITKDNADLVEKDYNQVDTNGARLALRLDLDENWTISPVVMGQRTKSGGINSYDPSVGEDKLTHFFPERADDKWIQSSLTVEGKVGNWSLTYAGAYMERSVDVDSDYTDYSFFYDVFAGYGAYLYDNNYELVDPSQYVEAKDRFNKWSQELRIASPQDASVRFVGGLFVQRQYHDIQQNYQIAGDIADWITVAGDPPPGLGYTLTAWPNTIWLTKQDRVDRDKAIFGELSWDVNDKLTLTGGGRYFESENSLKGFFGYARGFSSNTGEDACDGETGPTRPGREPEGEEYNEWLAHRTAPCTNVNKVTAEKDHIFKFNATYKFDGERMVYATWSEGYRPGGINRRGSLPPYQADFLTNMEIGWKTTWGGNFRFNGAVFQEDWDDFQFSILAANGLTEIRNANTARIRGVEADFQWAATAGLTLSGGFALLNAELTENYCGYVNTATGKPETNCDQPLAAEGTQLPITPEFKGNLTGRYEFPMGGFDAHFQATLAYTGEARIDLQDKDFAGQGSPTYNDPDSDVGSFDPADFNGTGYTDAYTVVDLSFGISKETYSVELFVNNLLDERAVLNRWAECRLGICGEQLYYTTNMPRSVALKYTHKF